MTCHPTSSIAVADELIKGTYARQRASAQDAHSTARPCRMYMLFVVHEDLLEEELI